MADILGRLKKLCEAKDVHAIGTVIYQKDDIAIHEVDGEHFKVRNACNAPLSLVLI
jgi:hypothetical protein